MPDRYTRERIENWVSDFVQSDALRALPGGAQAFAPDVLVPFLCAACDAAGSGPDEVSESDIRAGLLTTVAAIEMPESVHADAPALCGAFLEDMEREGRVSGGRVLGSFVRALAPAYRRARGGDKTPMKRVAPKLRPNDPCPCGSGTKYKKCCQGLLG